jgi:hypothetical protein
MLLVRYDAKVRDYVCASCSVPLALLDKGKARAEHDCPKRPWQAEALGQAVLLVAVKGGEPWILHDTRHPRRSFVSWEYLKERLSEERRHAEVERMYEEELGQDTGEE